MLGSDTICPPATRSTRTTSVYLASDLPGAFDLLFTVSRPLGGLSSACYKASKWKLLGRLCVDDFLPLFKGDTVL